MTMTSPFHGHFAVLGLELAMINVSTKFEVSIYTHYEGMKGDTKYRKWDGLGQLQVTEGDWK